MCDKREERTNYGKIIAITLAIVAGACAVVWFTIKLYRKYCLLDFEGYDELDDLSDDALFEENGECEVVIEGEDAPEAAE